MKIRTAWVWLAILGLVISAGLVATRGSSGSTSIEEQTHRIAAGLRCPVCQNLSVAESPSRLATEMRTQIRSMLTGGASPAQIRQHFVNAYGEWVLLDPPRAGLGVLTWLLPLVALALGGLAVAFALRTKRDPTLVTPSPEMRQRIAAELHRVKDPA